MISYDSRYFDILKKEEASQSLFTVLHERALNTSDRWDLCESLA